jgi:hypothetical protein
MTQTMEGPILIWTLELAQSTETRWNKMKQKKKKENEVR